MAREFGVKLLSVNLCSGNGLVSSDNKPLLEPMLIQIYITIWRHNELHHRYAVTINIQLKSMALWRWCLNSKALTRGYIYSRKYFIWQSSKPISLIMGLALIMTHQLLDHKYIFVFAKMTTGTPFSSIYKSGLGGVWAELVIPWPHVYIMILKSILLRFLPHLPGTHKVNGNARILFQIRSYCNGKHMLCSKWGLS